MYSSADETHFGARKILTGFGFDRIDVVAAESCKKFCPWNKLPIFIVRLRISAYNMAYEKHQYDFKIKSCLRLKFMTGSQKACKTTVQNILRYLSSNPTNLKYFFLLTLPKLTQCRCYP